MTDELLQLVPYHQRALGNRKYYMDILRDQVPAKQRGETARLVERKPDNHESESKEMKLHYFDPVNSLVEDDQKQSFTTSKLKLKKPTDNLPERENYERLCRYHG